MKIIIFGGTTEGRLLAQALSERGASAAVSVATPLGAAELAGLPGIVPLVGRKTQAEMERLLQGVDRCVDATHPYAQQASANIRAACEAAGVPLRRLLRRASALPPDAILADTPEQAAQLLAPTEGNLLLTTGSKALAAFSALDPTRLFPRVLPVEESLRACRQAGIPTRNIIALYGPFSQALNEALLEQYSIRWLVTKDGGAEGGFPEKLAAARRTGVRLVILRRPTEQGEELPELLAWLTQRDSP